MPSSSAVKLASAPAGRLAIKPVNALLESVGEAPCAQRGQQRIGRSAALSEHGAQASGGTSIALGVQDPGLFPAVAGERHDLAGLATFGVDDAQRHHRQRYA